MRTLSYFRRPGFGGLMARLGNRIMTKNKVTQAKIKVLIGAKLCSLREQRFALTRKT